MDIELRIGRLVLEGIPLPRQHTSALRNAVEVELARLLADGRFAPQAAGGWQSRSVSGPAVLLGTDQDATELGVRIAVSVWQGLNHA
jgi:hypothetical protein